MSLTIIYYIIIKAVITKQDPSKPDKSIKKTNERSSAFLRNRTYTTMLVHMTVKPHLPGNNGPGLIRQVKSRTVPHADKGIPTYFKRQLESLKKCVNVN